MSAARQVYYVSFDTVFLRLPPALRARVEAKIDDIGSQLGSFPHHRLKESDRFRTRIGDCRIIYTFDLEQNKIHLLAIGHRREIYRGIYGLPLSSDRGHLIAGVRSIISGLRASHAAPLSFLLPLACKSPCRGLGNWPAHGDDQVCRYAPKRE